MSRRGLSLREALDLVPDDMPDGAALAMASEMAGLEYGEGLESLAVDLGVIVARSAP